MILATDLAKAEDPVKRVERLLAGADRRLRESFLTAVAGIRSRATVRDLATLLEAGRVDEAIGLGIAHYEAFASEWVGVYVDAARDTAGFVGRRLNVVAVFDETNEAAVEAMRANRLRLVRELTESQRGAARQAILEGVEAGANPRQQARAFRESIGLTRKQEQIVRNYRAELEALDGRALGRRLRDGRFDRTVRGAIARDVPLERTQIDKMVGRYRERWVRYRSEVIGRTESLRSVHQGVEETYRQGIDAGTIDPSTIVRVWNTARDERVRNSHAAMHLQEQPIGRSFISGRGNALAHPGDPAAPPEDTVQCRCVLSTRFTAP